MKLWRVGHVFAEGGPATSEATVSDHRLSELKDQLARLDQAWTDWDRELFQAQKELEDAGMDRLEAAQVMHRRQVDAFRAGSTPVDLDQLHQVVDELCGLYLHAGEEQRQLIRSLMDGKERVRKYLHSYIGGRAASLVRSTGEPGWLDLGLAGASIANQKVDYRDLLIALGELWLAAEQVGLEPAGHFSAVAEMSSTEPVYGNRSTRELLRGFSTSGYLRSIKPKDVEA